LYFGDVVAAVAGDDEDGDLRANGDEFLANTDPLNASSALKLDGLESPSSDVVRVSLASSAQRMYTLYKSVDLKDPWNDVDGPLVGTDGLLKLEDGAAVEPQAFYRVGVALP